MIEPHAVVQRSCEETGPSVKLAPWHLPSSPRRDSPFAACVNSGDIGNCAGNYPMDQRHAYPFRVGVHEADELGRRAPVSAETARGQRHRRIAGPDMSRRSGGTMRRDSHSNAMRQARHKRNYEDQKRLQKRPAR